MTRVYVVQHLRDDPDGYDDVKFIGVYSTRKKADDAVGQLKLLPGFIDVPEGFHVQQYEVDKDHWTEGFADVSTA